MKHDEAVQKDFGRRLAAARDAMGLSLQGVADQLELVGIAVLRQTIGAWEDGRNVPDALAFRALARIYRKPADSILWGDDAQSAGLHPALLQRISLLSPAAMQGLQRVIEAHLAAIAADGAPIVEQVLLDRKALASALEHTAQSSRATQVDIAKLVELAIKSLDVRADRAAPSVPPAPAKAQPRTQSTT